MSSAGCSAILRGATDSIRVFLTDKNDPMFKKTKARLLSRQNPYYSKGQYFYGIGYDCFTFLSVLSLSSHHDHHIFHRGPHVSPVDPWPMALISAIFASDNDQEISGYLSTILSHTSGLGLIHESVDIHLDGVYTRPWFAWAKYVDQVNMRASPGVRRLTWLNFVTVLISRR